MWSNRICVNAMSFKIKVSIEFPSHDPANERQPFYWRILDYMQQTLIIIMWICELFSKNPWLSPSHITLFAHLKLKKKLRFFSIIRIFNLVFDSEIFNCWLGNDKMYTYSVEAVVLSHALLFNVQMLKGLFNNSTTFARIHTCAAIQFNA